MYVSLQSFVHVHVHICGIGMFGFVDWIGVAVLNFFIRFCIDNSAFESGANSCAYLCIWIFFICMV